MSDNIAEKRIRTIPGFDRIWKRVKEKGTWAELVKIAAEQILKIFWIFFLTKPNRNLAQDQTQEMDQYLELALLSKFWSISNSKIEYKMELWFRPQQLIIVWFL